MAAAGAAVPVAAVRPPPPVVTPPVVTPPTIEMPSLPAAGTAVAIASASDDPVVGGKSFSYNQSTARIDASRSGTLLQVDIQGDERWTVRIDLTPLSPTLQPGEYKNLVDSGDATRATAGYFVFAPARQPPDCQQRRTTLNLERISFDGDRLTELSFSFEQRCSLSAGPMKGRVRWLASDTTRGPGPVQPVPANLWAPPAGSTPASGNYVYVESTAGDPIGGGRTVLHTLADTRITTTLAGPMMDFIVRGDTQWVGKFRVMDALNRVQPGYYGDLRALFNSNPRKGALEWMAPLERCDDRTRGWFAVDNVQYRGDALALVELRFEQRCADGTGQPLRGKIRWSVDDTTRPPGPVLPVPAGLWQPPSQGLPASGNYIYLEGEAGEYISQGKTTLITPADFPLLVYDDSGVLRVSVVSSTTNEFSGDFSIDYSRRQLERGYYGGLLSTLRTNPAKGALRWSGQGRGCDSSGWFAVDDIAYTHGELRRIDLRFEQVCNGKRMHGRIKWASTDPVVLENRIDPPGTVPAAAPPVTPPATGSYVLLDGGADDYISFGGQYLYTQADAKLDVTLDANNLVVTVQGEQRWTGIFRPGNATGTFKVAPTFPVDGQPRMNWNGEGRACSIPYGSFTIDKLQNTANGVQALDLRFEQYCDGNYTPLRGTIRYVASDPTLPPGPVQPPPADLWRLPASQVPASGNYFFVHSAPGSFVGKGVNDLRTAADSTFTVYSRGHELEVRAEGQISWFLNVSPMLPLTRLQPGYYGELRRLISMNPARGALELSGGSRGCNELTGWFVVDAVNYAGNDLTALDLRLQQQCDGAGPPVYAQLRWRR